MTDSRFQHAAAALIEARKTMTPIAPIASAFGLSTIDEAYAVQNLVTQAGLNDGRRLTGRKIGLTSRAVQMQIGVDQPDFGMLWADYAFGEGETISSARFMQPKVEAEFAFVMGAAVPEPDISMTSFVSRLAYALPAVEIVDSAIADWKIGLVDTVADNASGGGYALGRMPLSIAQFDYRLAGMTITRNGQLVSTGVGAACLDHPFNAALWLARKMADVGRPLGEGDLVLSGALGPMVEAKAGDVFCIEIGAAAPLHFAFGE